MTKRLTLVDGGLTVARGTVNPLKGPLTCDDAGKVDGVDALNKNYRAHAHAHMRAHTRTHGARMENSVNPSTASTFPTPPIRGGRAVVDGVNHVMRLAKVSSKTARRHPDLNPNHHVRVWCECMADQRSTPGELPSGPYWTGRPPEAVASDPRRLGGWDALGVIDVRHGPSAVDLFRDHIRAVAYEARRKEGA